MSYSSPPLPQSSDAPPGAGDAGADAAAAIPAPHKGFLDRPWVQKSLPLATSLTIHAALILLGYTFLQAAAVVMRSATQEQIIIPDSTLAEAGPAGGIPNPGLGEDPNRATAQDAIAEVSADSQGWAERPSQSLTRALVGETVDGGESVISLGAGGAIGKLSGASAGGDAGQLAPFGIPGGGAGATGPRVSFIGVGGNARRIVYLVDASGSMTDAVDRLKAALVSSIDKLVPLQEFNVVVFRDEDVLVLNRGGLMRATTANKQKAFQWVADNYYVSGKTDPMPAIKVSFSQRPELLYVLTDGFDQIASFDDLKAEFRKHNAGNAVKVNTLLIRSRNEPELERVMKEIADANGGVFKAVERNSF